MTDEKDALPSDAENSALKPQAPEKDKPLAPEKPKDAEDPSQQPS